MVKTFLIFSLIWQLFSTPHTYQVKDSITHETLCGVAVKVNEKIIYTDLDGQFEYRPNQLAKISLVSYKDTIVNLSNNVIYLSQVK